MLLCLRWGYTQQIVVNDPADPQSALSAEDLLNEVLINSNACASATLELVQENPDGTTNTAQKSWGYFKRGASNFPFEEGIILSTGFADNAEGPNDQTGISDGGGGGWAGDADLKTILDAENGGNVATNNATVFQFRFTPVTNTISFDFIFASDEYENDQECASGGQFRDGFAFLIRGPGIPNDSGTAFGGTNMASIPGSTNISVNTFSIHRNTFMCGGENNGVNYFPNLYVSNTGADNQNEIQFDGLTQVLTASTNALTPGQEYTLKMVIGDRGDSGFDSAVFLSSGNFNLGGDLGDDMTIAGGNPACEGDTITLDGTASTGSTYAWYRDGVLLPDTTPTLDVTTSGTYRLDIDFGGNGNCVSSDEVIIEFKPLPNIGNPVTLFQCNQSGNATEDFMLTDNDANIIGGQTNVSVSYHISATDADNNVNPLSSPFNSASTTIFYRIDDDNANCFSTGSFQIVAGSLPQTIAVSNYELCDDNNDGDDTNGFVQSFILNSKDAEIINGQAGMSVSYHLNPGDASTGANPLASPYTNITANTQQIFYRIEETATGCFDLGAFSLVVNPLPSIQNTVLEQCDGEDGALDGLSIYNLEQANSFLITTGNVADFDFTYHLTQADAQNGINPQTPVPFSSTSTNQIIYTRVAYASTGCFRIAEITLGITTTDVPDYPLTVCDDDYDGFAQFDLSQADAIILAPPLPAGLTVVYYETQNDALFEINPLPNLYTNIVANNQTIYTRVEDGNACFGIGELVLQVNPIPAVTTVSDFVICSDTPPNAIFDLTSKDSEVLNGQNPANYTVSYHTSQMDASSNTNPVASPYTNTANPETIWVRITDNNNGCFVDSMSFDLIVHPIPNIGSPLALELCDNNNAGDGVEIFDLGSLDDSVSLGIDTYIVTYHETFADATANVNALPSMYQNTMMWNQTIFSRVTVPATGCFRTGEVMLTVNQTPVGTQPAILDFCDDDNDGVGSFDLNTVIPEITTNPNYVVTFHLSLQEAELGGTPLSSPFNNSSNLNPQTIYVRIEDPVTNNGCVNTELTLTLNVIDGPELPTELEDFIICDNDQDGFAVFDLTQAETNIFSSPDLVGTPADYTVTYHLTQADAQAGLPLIATPGAYTNGTAYNETIWVRVVHNASGCPAIRPMNLIVFDSPIDLTQAVTPLIVCDDLGGINDSTTLFDLTVKNSEIAQGNANVTISYFPSVLDAQNGTNVISDPTSYQNVINPQTLGVVVTDNTSGCAVITLLTIEVKPNPTPYQGALPALEACDGDQDGFATFDLSLNHGLILSTDNLSVIGGYFTSFNDAVNDTNEIVTPNSFINSTNPQSIWVRVESTLTSCFEIVTFDIINPLPVVSLTTDSSVVCVDENGVTIPGTEPVIDTGMDPTLYSFVWTLDGVTLPDTTSSILALTAGTYEVTVTDINSGCFNVATVVISESAPPSNYNAVVTTAAFSGDHIIEATASGNGTYQFSLDGGPYQDNGTFTGVEPGLHFVTITDVNGCGEVVIQVCAMDYPKYFTPNADGFHDTWNIIGGSCGIITNLYVFDRYGKLLKQLDPGGSGWDGTYSGNLLPATDYWFKVTYVEDGVEKEFRSHFAMKR